jgi:hypothetical protein
LRQVESGEPQGGWGPNPLGSQTGIARGVLCLPWDSFRVSNDCLKIEQVFESMQEGAVENPKLWRKILHGRRVKRRREAFVFCTFPCIIGASAVKTEVV